MPVITFNGPVGAGSFEIGPRVAHRLGLDYVDRLILAEKARRIGATVEAVATKEKRVGDLRDRITRFIQTTLERSALSGTGSEPYFGPGLDILLTREYSEIPDEPITSAHQLEDKHFLDVTKAVILDLARAGNVVINGRGSNMILKDMPGVLHVGLVAHLDTRVRTIMRREHLDEKEARAFAIREEKARLRYFQRFFGIDPNHPSHYHLMLNMDNVSIDAAVDIVVAAAKALVQ